MEKVKQLCGSWNEKINGIWDDQPLRGEEKQQKQSFATRTGNFCRANRGELLLVFLMGILLFSLSWILPFNEAPDEAMRYLIPQYIYRHGTLPAGYDPEVLNELWGVSYAYHPILPYVFGGYLMKLVGIFNSSDRALLMAARFVNIVIGMGFYWYVVQIAKKLFARRLFRNFFISLLALLPQLLYLFTYVNTDGIAVFSSAIIVYYWLVGMERKWDRKSCTGLAVGVSICALSYFNSYGYALFSIFLFVGTMIVFYRKKGAQYCVGAILKRGIYITVIFLLLTGWWFVRCAILYEGDFLGLYIGDQYAEIYAAEEYKPSVKQSLSEQGAPLSQMLSDEAGGMGWLTLTWRSTIGCFGFMKYFLGLDIYEIHKRIFALGGIGIGLQTMLSVLYYIRQKLFGKKKWWHSNSRTSGGKKQIVYTLDQQDALLEKPILSYQNCKIHPANFLMLQFSLVCCIMIPILLSMYYSYFTDFQAQGRYVMPMILPLMYFVTAGIQRFQTLFFRKWMVYVMMVPLFYAVLHVFLGAFISVYIPTYVEGMEAWANIRFPWFSNVGIFGRLFQMLIPG